MKPGLGRRLLEGLGIQAFWEAGRTMFSTEAEVHARRGLWGLTRFSLVVLFVVVLVLFAFGWLIIARKNRFFELMDEFLSRTGLPTELVYAIAIVGLLPYLWCWREMLHIYSKRRFYRGLSVMILLTSVWYSSIYAFSKDLLFTPGTGEAEKFINIRPDGSEYISDRPGVDPLTGDSLVPANPDLARFMFLDARGLLAEVSPGEDGWFDQRTGNPLLWYVRRDSSLHLFRAEGFDPATGSRLLPVTPDVRIEYLASRPDQSSLDSQSTVLKRLPPSLQEAAGSKTFATLVRSLSELRDSGVLAFGNRSDFLHPESCFVFLVEPKTGTVRYLLGAGDSRQYDYFSQAWVGSLRDRFRGIWVEVYE